MYRNIAEDVQLQTWGRFYRRAKRHWNISGVL